MDQEILLKHLRCQIFETVSDACVAGTTNMYQGSQAFSDQFAVTSESLPSDRFMLFNPTPQHVWVDLQTARHVGS